jgi:3-dehydroquinate synthase
VKFVDRVEYDADYIIKDYNVDLDSVYERAVDLFLGRERKVIEIKATEQAKEIGNVIKVIEKLLSMGVKRGDTLMAVGGGVIQDITGFIASTLFRGLKWKFVPTTLLAQGDSCIGGKTSINLQGAKNQLGTFHPPSEILICPGFLKTLPEQGIRSGLGEMLHYFYAGGSEALFSFERSIGGAIRREQDELTELIHQSLLIKRGFIEEDEFDQGKRLVLNYGHTFGHAIESYSNYAIPHGIAVAYGMDMSNRVSQHLGLLSPDVRLRMGRLCKLIAGTCPRIDIDRLWELMLRDKKNTEPGKVKAVLSRAPGYLFLQDITKEDLECLR